MGNTHKDITNEYLYIVLIEIIIDKVFIVTTQCCHFRRMDHKTNALQTNLCDLQLPKKLVFSPCQSQLVLMTSIIEIN